MFKLVSEDRQRKSTVLQIIRKSVPSGRAGVADNYQVTSTVIRKRLFILECSKCRRSISLQYSLYWCHIFHFAT